MDKSIRFTVFTPTYNRAHTLPRVYESLKFQIYTNFEWLIVDDGSTDNTKELIEKWQKESLFPIRYFWQNNAHKKTAFNLGVRQAQGELFFPLDSDDELLSGALDILNRYWEDIPEAERKGFTGVTGLCIDDNESIVGSKFPKDILDSDSLSIRFRYKIVGDKRGFNRTDILRKFPYPEDVKGHVPEGVVWYAIAVYYKTRFINQILAVYHAETDSIVHEFDSAEKYADGLALSAREVLCNHWQWFFYHPMLFLKTAANYTRFHLHLAKQVRDKRWILYGFVPFLLVYIMWLAGWGLYVRDKYIIERSKVIR